MCIDLTLRAMDQVFPDEDPFPRTPVASIKRANNITNWFNVTVDGRNIFVNVAIRRQGKNISECQLTRLQEVIRKNADVLRQLLGKTDSGNNILSIAVAGEDITVPEGVSQGQVGEISFQPFSVHFAGKNLMEMAKAKVGGFHQQIKYVIESEQ